MTGAEWGACSDPDELFEYLRNSNAASQRKCRLFATACCYRVLDLCPERHAFEIAVETAELFADGLRPQQDLFDAGEVLEIIESRLDPEDGDVESVALDARYHAMQVVSQAACSDSADCPYVYRMRDVVMHAAYVAGFRVASPSVDTVAWNRAEVAERRLLARFVREVFVDPFRSSPILPEWRTRTAVLLARQMYESRDFSAMPILADALQDVGCDSTDILGHCRGPGPHVRGCWVVDLVLGKQ